MATPSLGLMQPLIGALSDHSKSKWGRRRPFIICGPIFACICFLLLGWATEFIGLFITDEKTVKFLDRLLPLTCSY